MGDGTLEIIKLILQLLGTVGVGGIMAGIVTRKITKSEKKKELKDAETAKAEEDRQTLLENFAIGMRCLLRSEIIKICLKAKKDNRISLRNRQQLGEAYSVYSSPLLHGNSYTSSLVQYVFENIEVDEGFDD